MQSSLKGPKKSASTTWDKESWLSNPPSSQPDQWCHCHTCTHSSHPPPRRKTTCQATAPQLWAPICLCQHLSEHHTSVISGGNWCRRHGKGMELQPILKARIYFILFQKCMHYVWLYINVFIEPLKWFTMRYTLIIISAYLRKPCLPPQYLIHFDMFQLTVTPVNKSYWSTSWVIKLATCCKQLCHFI